MVQNSLPVRSAASVVKAARAAMGRKWSFLAVFIVVLFTTTATAATLDLLPEPKSQVAAVASKPLVLAVEPVPAVIAPELPMKIEIPALDLSVSVANPQTTDVAKLDQALLTGAVRYPTSSKLGEEGNTIIFGHSSYLPIVRNGSFKAFNGIEDLKAGDRIEVTGTGHRYVYAVENVEKVSANTDSIALTTGGSKLTLVTCNSFGDTADRFMVTATLVETIKI